MANLLLHSLQEFDDFTVKSELEPFHRGWAAVAAAGVILLHDVGFPCDRRDFVLELQDLLNARGAA